LQPADALAVSRLAHDATSPGTLTTPQRRIQAAAFASIDNAHAAVGRLAEAGLAQIEPVERPGGTLYRVTVTCRPGADPEAVRAQVAADGFPGARLLPAS